MKTRLIGVSVLSGISSVVQSTEHFASGPLYLARETFLWRMNARCQGKQISKHVFATIKKMPLVAQHFHRNIYQVKHWPDAVYHACEHGGSIPGQ
jgi:hypothetical protein